MSTFYCELCGPVVHQPIPEDVAHCPCGALFYRSVGAGPCDCPCHDDGRRS